MLDNKYNPTISRCCIWGGKKKLNSSTNTFLPTYTDDSDAVCILYHNIDRSLLKMGYDSYKLKFIIENQKRKYSSTKRNGISSRKWKNHSGLSIQLISIIGCSSSRLKEKKDVINYYSSSISFKGPNQEPMLPFKDLTISSDILIKKALKENPFATLEILDNKNEICHIRRCAKKSSDDILFLNIEIPNCTSLNILYNNLTFNRGIIENNNIPLLIGTHYRWV